MRSSEVADEVHAKRIRGTWTRMPALQLTTERNILTLLHDEDVCQDLLHSMKKTRTFLLRCAVTGRHEDEFDLGDAVVCQEDLGLDQPYDAWHETEHGDRPAEALTQYAKPDAVERATCSAIAEFSDVASRHLDADQYEKLRQSETGILNQGSTSVSPKALHNWAKVLHDVLQDGSDLLRTIYCHVIKNTRPSEIVELSPGDIVIARNNKVMHRQMMPNEEASDALSGDTIRLFHSDNGGEEALHVLMRPNNTDINVIRRIWKPYEEEDED